MRQYKVQGLPAAPPYQRFKGAWSWKGSIASGKDWQLAKNSVEGRVNVDAEAKRLEIDKMVWLMPSPLSCAQIIGTGGLPTALGTTNRLATSEERQKDNS